MNAGIRQARQNLSQLIAEVAKGNEITITDRGRPVARLVPPLAHGGPGVPDLSEFRKRMPVCDPPVSKLIEEGREDRF